MGGNSSGLRSTTYIQLSCGLYCTKCENKLPCTPSSRTMYQEPSRLQLLRRAMEGGRIQSPMMYVCNSDADVLLLATATHAAGGRLPARQTDLLAIAKAISANSRSHVRNMLLQFSTRASRSRVPLQQARGLPHGGSFLSKKYMSLVFEMQIAD